MRAVSLIGSYVGSLAETKEMLTLVKSGKVSPIPIEERPLAQASKTLEDLRQGKIIGRVVLRP
jgi:D-arabinose 1-dehydrogenase-like Zn-dependent alcohol dehydrogenase